MFREKHKNKRMGEESSTNKDWVGRGREVQEKGGMCIPMADSRWCVAEPNTALESNYPSITNLKTKKDYNRSLLKQVENSAWRKAKEAQ